MAAGRKREFSKADALSVAMMVFWHKGYSGTSVSDLTGAMGINKPSLYAAFGNKESLFLQTIEAYVEKYGTPHFDQLLGSASLRERVTAYLRSIAAMLADEKLPGGCFVAASSCEANGDCLPEAALKALANIHGETKSALVSVFEQEELKSGRSPEELADYLQTVQFGLAVMARNGDEEEALNRVVDTAVAIF